MDEEKEMRTYEEWVEFASDEADRISERYNVDYKVIFKDLLRRYNGDLLKRRSGIE